VQKGQLGVGRHDEETVGLRHGAGHLGQELRPRHADGDRQADTLADLPAQSRRDLDRRAGEPPEPADVEERLVDRQALHQRRGLPEHLEDRLARRRVRRHPRRHHDRLRTQLPGLPPTHRRAHAASLGLVAGRKHHATSDDHRPTTQPRIVPLLDRRVERVQVGMQDRPLARHDLIFAHTFE
jgi:hypothetical protein